MLKRIGLRYQIGLLAAIAGLCFVVLGGLYLYGNDNLLRISLAGDRASALAMEIEGLANDALQLRRHEKDFLLRREEAAVRLHHETTGRIGESLDRITPNPGDVGQERLRRALVDLRNLLSTYTASFDTLVKAARERGLTPDTGFEGSLRTAVRSIEERITKLNRDDLLVSMLLLRRHEKDFMLRHDRDSSDRFTAELATFARKLAGSGLAEDVRADIVGKLEAYRSGFERWRTADIGISTATGELSAAYRKVEPILDDIVAKVAAEGQQARDEAAGARDAMTRTMSLMIAAALLLTVALSLTVGGAIARPIRDMTATMERLAGGNLDMNVPATDWRNEIGRMARSVEIFKVNAIERRRLEAEQAEVAKRMAEQRRQDMHQLADGLERAVGSIVGSVSSAATELQAAAGTLTQVAQSTSQRSTAVAGASEEAAASIHTVAAAAEELTSSIHEIARQVGASDEIAQQAVVEAQSTVRVVRGLAETADRIGSIVGLIEEIASKTNLLALNATIEAARAGPAGRGFAVVASEVKGLAEQTAKATGDISGQVDAIQKATDQAADAIGSIGRTIDGVKQIATSISGAVHQQGAATQEIARNVQQASKGAVEVTDNIAGVSALVGESTASATQVYAAASELAEQAERLRGEVSDFLFNLRAA